MAMKEFEAHEWKKVPKKITFRTRDGKKVRFEAEVPKRVPKHVKFTAKG